MSTLTMPAYVACMAPKTDDSELHNINMLEIWVKDKKLIRYPVHTLFDVCSGCRKRRLIFCTDITSMSAFCYDCWVKHHVMQDMDNGTNTHETTTIYLATGKFMTVIDHVIKYTNSTSPEDYTDNSKEFDVDESDL